MINVQPTVVVGLGELGRRSVAYLKRRINESHGTLESFLLLAFTVQDGDDKEEARRAATLPIELLPGEHKVLDIKDMHHGAGFLRGQHPWLPEGVLGPDGTNRDARAASRLAFISYADELIKSLQDNLNRIFSAPARDAMRDKGLLVGQNAAVYVMAALDDPVGSGLFLDAAFVVREILRRIGVAAQTTAVLFLPEPRTLDETRGANVYAALKELDYHMSGNPFRQAYTPTFSVDTPLPPFSHGCYVMDTMNEKQVALGERDEASAMLGEWLFQATLTPCKQQMDGFISGASGRMQMVEGRLAEYGSLGLAGYILPIDAFVDWCANRLGDELIRDYVRGAVTKKEIVQSVSDFENNQSLTPTGFKSNAIGAPGLGDMSAQTIAALEVTPWAALEQRARNEARQLEQSALPTYSRQIAARQVAFREEATRQMKQQQHLLLNHPSTANHIPLALTFFNELKNKLEKYHDNQSAELEAGTKKVVARGKDVNRKAGTLFRTLSTIPRSALDYLLIGLGAVVGFLVPLFLVARLILSVAVPASPGFGYLLLALLVIASVAIVALVVWQIRGNLIRARSDFLSSFRHYIDARVDHANTRELLAFYPEMIQATRERADELMGLYNRVSAIRHDCARASAKTDALVGMIDFPLQRSLLTEDFIQAEYARYASEPEKVYRSFLAQVGTPATWLLRSGPELARDILDFGRDVFRPLRNHTVSRLLEMAPDDATRKRNVQYSAQELLDKSAPMWNYNKFVVGQDLTGAGYLTEYGLLALDDPNQSQLDNEYQAMKADLKTATTHDPYRLQMIKIRQGYPLYGLRAFNDFRQHYSTLLRDSRLPLHVADAYLLAQDPRPYPPNVDLHSSVASLFAVGCVAGPVGRENGGPYTVRISDKESRALAATPERSVALLGLDPEFTARLGEQIDKWAAEHGQDETVATLQEAGRQQDLSAWQVAAIEEYIGLLRS